MSSLGRSHRDRVLWQEPLRSAPSELGAIATAAAMERAGIEGSQVDHVVFGNVLHTEPGDVYMARVVGMRAGIPKVMKAGIPKEVLAYTVNRLCGTGVQAIVSATHAIQTGEADVAVAGGAESMSRGPHWMSSARWARGWATPSWSIP